MKKSIFLLFTLAFAFSLTSTALAAGYRVKIVNKSGKKIKVIKAKYKVVKSTWENCHPLTNKTIKDKKSKHCMISNVGSSSSSRHRWRVRYKCVGKKSKEHAKKSKLRDQSEPKKIPVTVFTIKDCDGTVEITYKAS